MAEPNNNYKKKTIRSQEEIRHKQIIRMEWIKFIGTILTFVIGLMVASNWYQEYQAINTLSSHVKSISPGLKIHYTNRYIEDIGKLEIKVYMKNISSNDIWIPIPCLFFSNYDANEITLSEDVTPAECASVKARTGYKHIDATNILGFQSMLAPSADYCITFNLEPPKDTQENIISGKAVGLQLHAQTNAAYTSLVRQMINRAPQDLLSTENKRQFEKSLNKLYGYFEKINTKWNQSPYGLGEDAYNNFCANPQ